MNGWQSIVQNFIIAIDPATQDPQQWRLLVALGILAVGLLIRLRNPRPLGVVRGNWFYQIACSW